MILYAFIMCLATAFRLLQVKDTAYYIQPNEVNEIVNSDFSYSILN